MYGLDKRIKESAKASAMLCHIPPAITLNLARAETRPNASLDSSTNATGIMAKIKQPTRFTRSPSL